MLVQFVPFVSLVEPALWHAYARLKLDELRLDDSNVPVTASYAPPLAVRHEDANAVASCTLRLGADGLRSQPTASGAYVHGRLVQFNTLHALRDADKRALFYETADRIYDAVRGRGDPARLNEFLVLVYADIKSHRYYYWFAFPALLFDPPWMLEGAWEPVAEVLGAEWTAHVSQQLASAAHEAAFWVGDGMLTPLDTPGDVLVFVDPSPVTAPGWPLRNILAYIATTHRMRRVRVVCWKDVPGAKMQRSVIGTLVLPAPLDAPPLVLRDSGAPDAVGWERNAHRRLAPKVASLGEMLDPRVLAERAVDLNLQLMRWRMVPDLPLERIQQTRALLLGAGTLGSFVARALLGWGVRHIALLDSGRVSFSNPVRQPLYEYSDCLGGGQFKADAAAEMLRRVFPGVHSEAHRLEIPMPGHSVPPALVEQVVDAVAELERLYDAHDVVILTTDTRESRWLPTILGMAMGKPVINAALGFETFVVMRHGLRGGGGGGGGDDDSGLGCYFCSDVVAPADSVSDRTLDQMCTVSRPGLAAIAGATAVELYITLATHARGVHAPAGEDGGVPHQIRGSLGTFSMHVTQCPAFWGCTACAAAVVNAYRARRARFVVDVCNDARMLEDISGLGALKRDTDALALDIDWSSSDSKN